MGVISSIIAEGIREAQHHERVRKEPKTPNREVPVRCFECGNPPEKIFMESGSIIYRCCKMVGHGARTWNSVNEHNSKVAGYNNGKLTLELES